MVDEALRLNPAFAQAMVTRAALLGEQAVQHSNPAARRRTAAEATDLLERALELNRLLESECQEVRARLAELAGES
jgi:hypothetical protein